MAALGVIQRSVTGCVESDMHCTVPIVPSSVAEMRELFRR